MKLLSVRPLKFSHCKPGPKIHLFSVGSLNNVALVSNVHKIRLKSAGSLQIAFELVPQNVAIASWVYIKCWHSQSGPQNVAIVNLDNSKCGLMSVISTKCGYFQLDLYKMYIKNVYKNVAIVSSHVYKM